MGKKLIRRAPVPTKYVLGAVTQPVERPPEPEPNLNRKNRRLKKRLERRGKPVNITRHAPRTEGRYEMPDGRRLPLSVARAEVEAQLAEAKKAEQAASEPVIDADESGAIDSDS